MAVYCICMDAPFAGWSLRALARSWWTLPCRTPHKRIALTRFFVQTHGIDPAQCTSPQQAPPFAARMRMHACMGFNLGFQAAVMPGERVDAIYAADRMAEEKAMQRSN